MTDHGFMRRDLSQRTSSRTKASAGAGATRWREQMNVLSDATRRTVVAVCSLILKTIRERERPPPTSEMRRMSSSRGEVAIVKEADNKKERKVNEITFIYKYLEF